MTRLVTIFGGAGFLGRHVARRFSKAGWRVRVATRRPNENLFLRTYGVVGQVEPVLCNIRDEASVRAAIRGADAVVNCVGLLSPFKKNSFEAVQHEGAGRVARLAAEAGVAKLVHISAIGADAESPSDYARSKAEGEAAVLAAFPAAVILRPSVMFGNEDTFLNRFATLSRLIPVLPVAGAETRLQPVYVDDVAEAAERAILGEAAGAYELGGPDVMTVRECVQYVIDNSRRRRFVIAMPRPVAGLMAWGLDLVQSLSFGLVKNGLLTRDQLRLLGSDNVVSPEAKGFADLGIAPSTLDLIAPTYLWRFRPVGQFQDIRESAANLAPRG